jgi:hypothetical protein
MHTPYQQIMVMDPLSFLANLLLSVTIGTLVVALTAYLAYKLREKRRPARGKPSPAGGDEAPVFLRRYVPEQDPQSARSVQTEH